MISIRHILKSDFDDLKLFVSNNNVAKYLTWRAYSQNKEIISFLDKTNKCVGFPNEYLAVVYNKRLIGTIHLISRGNGFIQFGFGILPKYWGKGIGNVIIKKSINHIRISNWLNNVVEIWADIHQNNIYAKKILLNNNFIYSGPINKESDRERYKLVWKEHYKKNF